MPKPSLKDAYIKRDRGYEHLVELDALVIEICNAQAKRIVIKPRPNVSISPGHAGVIADTDWGERVEIPDRCRVLAGDAANSFRSSLDYLVGRLAVLDSGPGNRRTQFPIEHSPDVFRTRRKTYLAGLSNVHVDAIARLQPCNGCDWTKNLALLSNLDKHNELVFIQHAIAPRITPTQRPKTWEAEKTTCNSGSSTMIALTFGFRARIPASLEENVVSPSNLPMFDPRSGASRTRIRPRAPESSSSLPPFQLTTVPP